MGKEKQTLLLKFENKNTMNQRQQLEQQLIEKAMKDVSSYPQFMNINNQENSYYFKIAAKASTLRERIEEPQRFSFTGQGGEKWKQRRAEWQRMTAPDEPSLFLARLTNDGLSEDSLKPVLGDVAIFNDADLPDWMPLFREIMEYLETYQISAIQLDIEQMFGFATENTPTFIHLVTPIVAFAKTKLGNKINALKDKLLTNEANQMINRQLALTLVYNASQTFQLEFHVFRSMRQSSFDRIFGQIKTNADGDVALYNEFVQKMTSGGWVSFFAEYCALARLIAIKTSYWIANTSEFLLRLDGEYAEIVSHFAGNSQIGRLSHYHSGISDSHTHGHGVVSLKFESGLKLVYKPKNLELELAFTELLLWFNEKGLEPGLKPLDVLQKGDYGWVGFIEADECISEQEVSDYYKRIGSLIGIIYLLNGNDCHHENLIASGPFPVLVDLETIMHHEGKGMMDEFTDSAVYLANQQFGTSVFRSGLLPTWITTKDDFVFDVSGIGGYGYSKSPYRMLVWKKINTDDMHFDFENYSFGEQPNLPVLKGEKQLPGHYADEIVKGFTSFYQLALEHRQEVPVQLFAGKELRFIFRSTRIYGFIMKKVLDPKFMRDGVDRSIQLEPVSRAFLHNTPPDPFWAICKSELRQMEETDFPIFWADGDNIDLKDSSGILMKSFMRCPIYDQVVNRLSELDGKDLAKQVKFIQASLYFRELSHSNEPGDVGRNLPEKTKAATRESLLKAAIDIGIRLNDEAIYSPDGSCSWITTGIVPGSEKYRMQPMGMFIYDGFAGVAMFLSALSTVSDNPDIQMISDAILKSLRRTLSEVERNSRYMKMNPTGIASGISSLIYSFLSISRFSNDPTWVDGALAFSRVIDKNLILRDKNHDIISGNAGAILALLKLYKETGLQEVLDKAIACGDHLLGTATEMPDGNVGWITMGGKALAGFSHGVAGIAYSLLKLYEASGNKEYYGIAIKSISYENSLFSAEHSNWADLRPAPGTVSPELSKFMTAWCHGATGIGLGRLAGQVLFNNDRIEADIRLALSTTRNTSLTNRDHLCCGNMGRIEAILYAALKTNDQDLMNEAYEKAGFVIDRATKRGHYDIFADQTLDFFNPGFFQGLSGIGYEFLRLAFPDQFPSVLVFE